MAIKKEVTLESTGGVAGYHYLTNVTIDRMNGFTTATVQSFVSADTFAAKKQPVAFGSPVSVAGIPEKGVDPFEFVEAQLVAPKPDDAVDQPILAGSIVLSRYTFAGGELVA